jgi:hypothetical protein
MKKQLNLLLFGLLCTAACYGQATGEAAPLRTGLQKTIDSLAVVDQQVQQDVIAAAMAGKSKQEINPLMDRQDEVMRRHKPLLENILRTHGFPSYALVGKTSSHNFWLLVQHCDDDPAFQRQVLTLMGEEVRRGNADPRDYAYLVDRVNLNTGKSQVYGTQVTYRDGKAVPKALQDADRVDQRREEVGLKPLAEYLREMTEAHQRMNPSLQKPGK